MKNFWPHRVNPKGFSIENLARKYRQKISDVNSSNTLKGSVNNIGINSLQEERRNIIVPDVSVNKLHWANRDFSEYREVA